MLTSSGDATCNLWDTEQGRPVRIFRDHGADVMSVSVSKTDPNIFVSGSCDALALVRPCDGLCYDWRDGGGVGGVASRILI